MEIKQSILLIKFTGTNRELKKYFKMLCSEEGTNMSQTVKDFMEESLMQHDYFGRLYKESKDRIKKESKIKIGLNN